MPTRAQPGFGPTKAFGPATGEDNFESMDGYGNRFGLIHVDFDTLERTPELCAEWFRYAARQNAVV